MKIPVLSILLGFKIKIEDQKNEMTYIVKRQSLIKKISLKLLKE